jgi:hypothetical protein
MRYRVAVAAIAFVLFSPLFARAQDGFDFWISESLLKEIVEGKSLLVPLEVDLKARSAVHKLGKDCELHVAAVPVPAVANKTLTAPKSWVLEPPYLCKNASPTGSTDWETFFDEKLLSHEGPCTVVGFPRILDEHLQGEETLTNPHHAFEVHPALRMKCGDATVEFTKFLQHHAGMSEIKPASAASCFNMEVRVRRNKATARYELQVDRPKFCGNFLSYEMSIFSEWIRAINSANPTTGHSAIARVKPEGLDGPRTLKIYTLPGTKEDDELEQWRKDWNDAQGEGEPHHGAFFHGLTTIDYFALWKTVTDPDGNQLTLKEWTEVKFPLALVVYGTVDDPNPEADEGEEFE